MQKILVPTDFSRNALKAITYACEMASITRATVYVIHVIEPSINMATMQADSSRPKVLKERSFQLRMAKESIAAIYPSVQVITHLAGGDIDDQIVHFCQKEKMDLIIMGTTGASGIKRLFMGSVAANTIKKSPVPVLTIPASYEPQPPSRILFATRLFEKEPEILAPLLGMASIFSAEIHVAAYVGPEDKEHAGHIFNEEQFTAYANHIHSLAQDIPIRTTMLEGKNFETATDRYVQAHAIDIITLVAYPKSFLDRLLSRSATAAMAFHSTTPLLVIPAHRAEA